MTTPDAAEDAVYKALLMLLQRAPLSLHIAEQFIHWLEQDGFTVTRRPPTPAEPCLYCGEVIAQRPCPQCPAADRPGAPRTGDGSCLGCRLGTQGQCCM